MKIFLTGGTGFIGSHFINLAIEHGHNIIALKRTGAQPRVPLKVEPEWLIGNLDEEFAEIFDEVDVFVHLAAHSANYPYDSLNNCLYWNLTSTVRLIQSAAFCGVNRFIIAGSCFEYGKSCDRIQELNIDSPLEPTNSYSISKAASSIALLGLARELGLELKLLRIFQVYGEGEQASRFWPALKKAALSGTDFHMTKGEQLRDFISVKDVARQFDAALDFSQINSGYPLIKHVATGKSQRLIEFANHCWKEWGARGRIINDKLPYRKDELMRITTSSNAI